MTRFPRRQRHKVKDTGWEEDDKGEDRASVECMEC